MLAKVLKSCPKSNKSPNLVTLSVMASRYVRDISRGIISQQKSGRVRSRSRSGRPPQLFKKSRLRSGRPLWKKVVLFTPTSGHTGSNASQMGDQYRKYTLKGQLGLLATTSPIYLLALKDDSHSTHVRICRFCKRPHQRRIGNCLSCLYPNESGEISLP